MRFDFESIGGAHRPLLLSAHARGVFHQAERNSELESGGRLVAHEARKLGCFIGLATRADKISCGVHFTAKGVSVGIAYRSRKLDGGVAEDRGFDTCRHLLQKLRRPNAAESEFAGLREDTFSLCIEVLGCLVDNEKGERTVFLGEVGALVGTGKALCDKEGPNTLELSAPRRRCEVLMSTIFFS